MAVPSSFNRWLINRDELLKLFSIIQKFPGVGSTVVGMRKEGHALLFACTNRDHYVDAKFDLLNDEDVELSETPIYFNFATMNYLVNAAQEFFLVWRNETKELFFVTPDFQVKVDTFPLNGGFPSRTFTVKPDTPFFPMQVLETLHFLFGQTDNPMESKAYVEGGKIWLSFQEFSAALYYEPVDDKGIPSSPDPWPKFTLRKLDIPIMIAFHKVTKGEALFALSQLPGESRAVSRFENITLSFLILPTKLGLKEPAVPSLDAGEAVGFDRLKLLTALKTLDFLKAPNVDFVSKSEVIQASSQHSKFLVGKGSVQGFSMSVNKLLSFLAAIPLNAQKVITKKTTSSVVFGFRSKDLVVIFDVRAMMSSVTAKPKALVTPSWAQPAVTGNPGDAMKSFGG